MSRRKAAPASGDASACRSRLTDSPGTWLASSRAYAVEWIGAAFVARAAGVGHRRIGSRLGVPAATVRGWLRVMADRLERVRTTLLVLAHRVGVDQPIPKAQGCAWRDLLAVLEATLAAAAEDALGFGVLDHPRMSIEPSVDGPV